MTNDNPLYKGALERQDSYKRKASEDEDERRSSNIKKAKSSLLFLLESESSSSEISKEESVHSAQEYDTDLARDTSDTSTRTSSTGTESNISVHIEYELDSQSENENPIAGSSTETYSIPEEIVINIVTGNESGGSADNSDSTNSSLDYVIKSDFRYCTLCRNLNSNPLYPSCAKCFKAKKNNQSSRPKRKARAAVNQNNNHSMKIQKIIEADSRMVFSTHINRSFEPQCNGKKNDSSSPNLVKNRTDTNSEPKSSKTDTSSTLHESSIKQQINRDNDLCNICFERPKDGAMSHGRTQHVYSCYECAFKIFKSSKKRCPICNRKITAVYKQFN